MSERYSPLWELTLSRVREVLREPGFVFWIFGFPVLMAIGLGIAFRDRPPEKPVVAVVSSDAEWLESALTENEDIQAEFVDEATAIEHLRSGRADLLVRVVPAQPVQPVQPIGGDDGAAEIEYRYDEMKASGRLARHLTDSALQSALGREDARPTTDTVVTEKGARYIDFLMPGLIGLNLMGSSMWGIGYSIVLARKRRQLRRFAATPMRRADFLLGYVFSRLVFLVMELAGLIGFGFLAFGVQIQGSALALIFVSLVGATSFGAIGLVVAARVESVEAANGWMNFIMMPMWILSGSFFPYEKFPEVVHPFLQALPLTALNDALRAIVNEGASIVAVLPELGVLAAWGVVPFALALKWFRWQ